MKMLTADLAKLDDFRQRRYWDEFGWLYRSVEVCN
jgi:hypothetical protein